MIHIRPARLEGIVKRHWEDTILKRRTLDEISPYLSSKEIEILKNTNKTDFILWGDTNGNRSEWEKLKIGDLVLFSGFNKYHSKGLVESKFINKDLALFLWPEHWKPGPHLNIFTISNLFTDMDVSVPKTNKLIYKKDGEPYKETNRHQGATALENNQVSDKFMSIIDAGWSNFNDVKHGGKGLPRDIVHKTGAEIYKITFEIDDKNMVYVGQDIDKDPSYLSSSTVIWHYRKLYGNKLKLNKEQLYNWDGEVSQGEINDKEQYFIKHYIKKVKDMEDYYSINYSGENQPKYKEV